MNLLALLISIAIWGVIFYVLWWGLKTLALPEPFNKVGTVVLVIATVVVLIGVLTGSITPFPFVANLTV